MVLSVWLLFGILGGPLQVGPPTGHRIILEARLQGVVCTLKPGDQLAVVGDTVAFLEQGDTLRVKIRHRVQSWLARWGWAADTLVIQVPQGVPVEIHLQQQGGLLVLQADSLNLQALRIRLRHTRVVLDLQGARRLSHLSLQASWSRLWIGPFPRSAPEYVHLQTYLCQVVLDLRTPPQHEVPVVLASQMCSLHLIRNGTPVVADRQGFLNLGPLPSGSQGSGYHVLITGNFNRLRLSPPARASGILGKGR